MIILRLRISTVLNDLQGFFILPNTANFLHLQMFALHLGSKTSSNLEMIKQTRTIVDGMNAKFGEDVAFMYGFPFLFYEQYLHSYRDLYLVVGLALGTSFQLTIS